MGGTGAGQSTAEASNRWRKYPANFLYSGYFDSSSALIRGSYGLCWSSTAYDAYYSYYPYFYSYGVYPGPDGNKNHGLPARCVLGP